MIHLLSLAAAVPVLLWVNRDQWFSADEWVVVLTGGLGSNPQRAGLFAPHFEHWTTLVTLVYRALYSVFALHTYVPYTLVLIAVVLATTHMLWRLLLRVQVNPAYATVVAAIYAVLAIGYENRSTAFQIAIVAPVALGFGALLVMPERGPFGRRDLAIWALLVVGLMCSGTGVTMTIVVGVAAFLRRGWRVAATVVSLPTTVYLLWFVTEGTKGPRNAVPLRTALEDLPGFVWRGLTGALTGLTRIPASGPVVLVLLAAWLVWRARPRSEPWPLVLATSLAAVASMTLTGLRRAGADSQASRYADIVVVLLLPALALATQDVARVIVRRVGRLAVVGFAGLMVVVLVAQVVGLHHYVDSETFVGEMKPRVLGTAVLLRDREPVVSTNIFGIPYLSEPSTSTIARFDRNGELPSTADVTKADVLNAREYVEMAVGGAALYDEGVASVIGSTNARLVPSGEPGCVEVRPKQGREPSVTLDVPSAASFRLRHRKDDLVPVQFDEGSARGKPRVLSLAAGQELVLSVARGGMRVRLGPPSAGPTTLCGLSL